ncbi:fructokinase [Elusimicrobium simillimum]|uniref:carbohydrate kinase family protein n=1 Tax=Elusimicrobium simillimum TaxID=3143438 RepID=UPI003C6F2360
MTKILSVGEVLLDIFPVGAKLGGAPANYAWYCSQYGYESYIVSAVGSDDNGARIMRELKDMGMGTSMIQKLDKYPTGTVKVTLNSNLGPRYAIAENVAWDHIEFTPEVAALAAEADVICFGTLAQRSPVTKATIDSILAAAKKDAVKIFDINLRQSFFSKGIIEDSLAQANILKISSEELPVVADMLEMQGEEVELCRQILQKYNLAIVILTKSYDGSIIITHDTEHRHDGTLVDNLEDTVGAGDSFAATFSHGFLKGADFDLIGASANEVASYVCTSKGAMVKLPEALTAIFN